MRNLPAEILAATDGQHIWMTPEQMEVEQRCSLAHELIHIERGHDGCQPPAVEKDVCAEAARRLIPIDQLANAATWTSHADELAEELWVDRDTLQTRMNTLNEDERQALLDALARRDNDA